MPTSIFSDEWRECLVAHYTHVLRNSDGRTERTLRGVMLDAGFTEDDLSRIYITATAHVDDVPDDFTPDSRFLESVVTPEVVVSPAPAEAAPPQDEPPFDTSFDDADSQELLALDDSEILDASELEAEDPLPTNEPEDDAPPADPDATQLSLF